MTALHNSAMVKHLKIGTIFLFQIKMHIIITLPCSNLLSDTLLHTFSFVLTNQTAETPLCICHKFLNIFTACQPY